MSGSRQEHPTGAPGTAGAAPPRGRAWLDGLGTVLAGIVVMWIVATLGLWAAGATDLPDGAFPRVVAAVVVDAVGGTVELHGNAGFLAQTDAALDVVPLSVTLVGALVIGVLFLRPLRRRPAVTGAELGGRVAWTAGWWIVALIVLAVVTRHTFKVSVGGGIAQELGDALDAAPTVGFRADGVATVGLGLLWLLAVLALTFMVSRKAPLPTGARRFQDAVRPPAHAMLLVLLCCVVIGVIVGVIVAIAGDYPGETFAVVLLSLPNLVWMGLGIGMGGSWDGHVTKPVGLPMPQVLDQVLRTGGNDRTLDLGTLAGYDGRAWLLLPAAAVLLLGAGILAALRTPADGGGRMQPWRHALRMAVAVGVTLLVVGLVTPIEARFGLSVLGVGNIDSLGGNITLDPNLGALVGFGLLWGLVVGFIGGLVAARRRRSGEAE
ncbi:streptophobe family protein [Streptomyces meridianus]|uniref:Streptophobe family protein n=1 Tax=Streptomyces meridianus TaxID=2938945 RepID=A0ABT0XC66_9ACTN|nr:streptophobe family protein [Streptomyces meridianus]MCM2579394.1 streptophobe family protein [Streptomyces meridianus]